MYVGMHAHKHCINVHKQMCVFFLNTVALIILFVSRFNRLS